MPSPICIKCGADKTTAWEACSVCGFEPHSDVDRAKSFYLAPESVAFGILTEDERVRAQLLLRDGLAVEYNEQELAQVMRLQRELQKIPLRSVWGAVFRLFIPAIVILALILVLAVTLHIFNIFRQ